MQMISQHVMTGILEELGWIEYVHKMHMYIPPVDQR